MAPSAVVGERQRSCPEAEPIKNKTKNDTEPCNRTIIEYCCGSESKLGQLTRFSKECKRVRLTIENDLRTEKGRRQALDEVRQADGSILLWCAIPCTGGSPWQNYNKKFPNARIMIAQHIADFV